MAEHDFTITVGVVCSHCGEAQQVEQGPGPVGNFAAFYIDVEPCRYCIKAAEERGREARDE